MAKSAPARRLAAAEHITKHLKPQSSTILQDSGEDDTAQGLFVPLAIENPYTRKQRQSTARNEYEDDPGRIAGQQFLQDVKSASKKQKVVRKQALDFKNIFKSSVHTKTCELARQLDDEQTDSINRDARFLDTFEMIYRGAIGLDVSGQDAAFQAVNLGQDALFTELYQDCSQTLAMAFELINNFETYDNNLAVEKNKLFISPITSECAGLQQLLNSGRMVGENRIDHLLRGTVQDKVKETDSVFYKGGIQGSTYNMIARHEQNLMRRTARLVLMETNE